MIRLPLFPAYRPLLAALLCPLLHAEFPKVYNSEPSDRQPPSPQASLAMLKLPPGFQATLFAAEPDVQNPIGMAWDTRGRMWVAENYTYAERAKRFDLGLKDRVIILEDRDWDGRAEKRTVFIDDVQRLTSVEIGQGGVWLLCPPQLLFVPDADGDDVPDGPAQVRLDGFTVADANYHNFANGLRWGPDGWLYGRCGHSCPGLLGVPGTPDAARIPIKGGLWRFHPQRQIVEVLTHGTTNPWGHDWDANGELFFINTVTGHLWHLIPGAHLHDTSPSRNPYVYQRLDTIADHYHFDTRGRWQDSRDGQADAYGGGHAHVGMMIYQADQWPDAYRNKLFTLNMHGRRANVERLERLGSGYVGRHEPDVFFTNDPWFRGIEISVGPDGSGFILDWCDTGECHDSTGVHRTSGRIFRISYGQPSKPQLPFAWRRQPPQPDLNSANEYARVRAIRQITDFWPIDTLESKRPLGMPEKEALTAEQLESWQQFLRMAKDDPSSLVHLTLASTLQRLPWAQRPALAQELVLHARHAEDKNLPFMVNYGLIPLIETNPQALVQIAKASTWPNTTRWIARVLAGRVESQPELLNALLTQAVDLSLSSRESILTGLTEAFQGWRQAPRPAAWERFANSLSSELVAPLSRLFGDNRALKELERIALDPQADVNQRRIALKSLIDARPAHLRALCEKLLEERSLAAQAASGLASFDDPAVGRLLAARYPAFAVEDRPTLLDLLVTRPSFARALLQQLTAGTIAKTDLSAFHARQIRSLNDAALQRQLTKVWGDVREATGDKAQIIAELKAFLTPAQLAQANLSQGRLLYQICAGCHKLYGEGGQVGPDLTGSGRTNLDYLLENIVDPSGVVSADYRLSVLTLKDGRTLSGVLAAQNDRTLTLRQIAQEIVVEKDEITKQEIVPVSMMPEGLLSALQRDQIRDLIAYLMHPNQVPLPAAETRSN